MRQNREFEKKAAYRRRLAFFIALVVYLSVFAAIVFQGQVPEILPGFIKTPPVEKSQAPKA